MDYGYLIGKKIKEYRELKGWSQEDLAEKAGLSTKYIGYIERGIKIPKLKTFILLANTLGVSANDLLKDVLDTEYSVKIDNLNKKINSIDIEEQKKFLKIFEFLSHE